MLIILNYIFFLWVKILPDTHYNFIWLNRESAKDLLGIIRNQISCLQENADDYS